MTLSPDSLPDRPLAESIAVATRSSHTRLNKSIIARLPLVVGASDPSPYVAGLLHIAPIYLTFESLWRSLLDSPSTTLGASDEADGVSREIEDTKDTDRSQRSQITAMDSRVRAILDRLYLPDLMRSDRLRLDIRSLTGWSEQDSEDQLRITSSTGRLGEFTAHIKQSVEQKPHTLVAYSYILFMALFAGGRFIRATLETAGDDFWQQSPSGIHPAVSPDVRGEPSDWKPPSRMTKDEIFDRDETSHPDHRLPLRFFHFPTPLDGEDLKRDFKKSLLESESDLTKQEKTDIVQEAVCIFDHMELLVTQLDEACAHMKPDESKQSLSKEGLATLLRNPMATRLRDSVAVHKDRAARSSTRMSSSSEDTTCSVGMSRRARGPDAATSTTSLNKVFGHSHPPVPGAAAAAELCPALRSMRFDVNLPKPSRVGHEGTERALVSGNTTNWMLFAAIGAVVVGLAITTRRAMMST